MSSFLAQIVPQDDSAPVVEIGCGSGRLLTLVSELTGCPGIGVDLSFTILKRAQEMSPTVRLAQGAAEHVPLALERANVVYFADLLEHLVDPDGFLQRLSRQVENLVVLVPLESGLIADLLYRYRRWRGKPTNYEKYGHLHRWTRWQVLPMMERAGLKLQGLTVFRGRVTRFTGWRGRSVYLLSELVFRLSSALHERLFGGYAFVAWYTGQEGQ
jgi:ubiquinone/menaquinone biosynthesis C-methylase UbiE